MSQGKLVIAWVIGEVGGPDIGNQLPWGPGHPSQGLPGGGYPSHGLPGGGYPSQGLPSGGRPDNSLPWAPGNPDNSLPLPPGITPPPVPPPLKDKLVVLWRLPNTAEWHGKAMDPSERPEQGLPGSQPGIDNALPGGVPPRPDAGLPPSGQPKT